jgi:L-alanine-DL-glutamate epimerase-like enolase superfamily enzyme
LAALARRYDALNLKLDKLGGLTAALSAREAIVREGMKLMVGCHMCTSLSLAPAMLVAADAALVDLDAGLLLSRDRDGGVRYRGSEMQPLPALWGVPRAATS